MGCVDLPSWLFVSWRWVYLSGLAPAGQDICADVIELEASVGVLTAEIAQTQPTVAKVRNLIALSEKITADTGLARQLRRKLVQ